MPPIVWHTSSRTPDGYGDEARGFLRSMEASGMHPALRDLSNWTEQRAGLSASESAMLDRQEARYASLENPGRSVHVHHYVPGKALKALMVEGALNVSRSTFETDRIPSSWLPYLGLMDEIWVPTEFNVKTYVNSGIPHEKLRVVGQTLDFELFDPDRDVEPLQIPGVPEDSFVFLANFDFSERKGWRQLLKAWELAFDRSDPVCLVLKTATISFAGDHIEQRIGDFFGQYANVAPVVVYSKMLEAEEMPRLYAAADAYVLPSRGEGWGRPYMEALALNMPTIGSNWSGQVDFMKPEYSWLVEGEVVPVPDEAEIANNLYQGHKWFEADAEILAAALREVASDPAASREKASMARRRLLERFSPAQISDRTAELAEDLWERRGSALSRPQGSVRAAEHPEEPGMAGVVMGLQSTLEKSSGAVYRINSGRPYPQFSALRGILLDYQPEEYAAPLLVYVDQGINPPAQIAEAAGELDLVVVPSEERRSALAAAGVAEGIMIVVTRAPWKSSVGQDFGGPARQVVAELESLRDQGVEPIRVATPAALDAKGRTVLWMPDFEGPWLDDFKRWVGGGSSGEETLVIWSELDEGELGDHLAELEAILDGVDPAPDILLVLPGEQSIASVVRASQKMLCGPGSLSPGVARRRLSCI